MFFINPDTPNDNPTDTSSNEQQSEDDIKKDAASVLDDKIDDISNDSELSNAEKQAKIIEALEEAKAKYQAEGNVDKVTEMDANIEAIKSLPVDNETPTAPPDSVAQPMEERQ
jgi:predicted transcriptional regulator YheO